MEINSFEFERMIREYFSDFDTGIILGFLLKNKIPRKLAVELIDDMIEKREHDENKKDEIKYQEAKE